MSFMRRRYAMNKKGDVMNNENIQRRDWEQKIYKECDKEDRQNMNKPRETIKEVFDLQILRARFAFNQGLYSLCRVFLADAEKMAENLEKLNQEIIEGKKS
jgi:hypothetical protein